MIEKDLLRRCSHIARSVWQAPEPARVINRIGGRKNFRKRQEGILDLLATTRGRAARSPC